MNQPVVIYGLERLNGFVLSRLRHPDTHTLNVLNSSLGNWQRYYEYLQIIHWRYDEAAALFMEVMQRRLAPRNGAPIGSGSRPMTEEEYKDLRLSGELGNRVHLEIESFYVFANILLDRIASSLRYYFWRKPAWNHRHVVDHIEEICAKKSLTIRPPGLISMPRELQEMVVAYRNKYVEHAEDPRLILATSWGPDMRPRIYPTLICPSPEEVETIQRPSGDLAHVLSKVEQYMIALLDFFDANADKSILPPP